MTNKVALRSGKDRLRYSFTFEVSLMALFIPAGAVFFDKPFENVGLLTLILALKAMLVSLVFNWVFDHIDARHGCVASERSPVGRFLHAIGFEFTLVLTSLPFFMWLLDLTLPEALTTDLVVISFVVIYTYVFTLCYDRLFPVQSRRIPMPHKYLTRYQSPTLS